MQLFLGSLKVYDRIATGHDFRDTTTLLALLQGSQAFYVSRVFNSLKSHVKIWLLYKN